ncbi:MAG: substrate-binding domain-containing protein [Actinobacteria bacterium]|nr:substrate-binding domain-containing protein [Actinomycetota bacterium]
MNSTPGRTRVVASAAVAFAALLAAGLAGCSGDAGAASASKGSVDPEVTAQLDSYAKPVSEAYSGAPFSAAPAAGKKVLWVTFYSGNPFLAAVGTSFQKALQSQGVTVSTCDGKGNPVDVNACISQGVAQGADAIQVDGPETATYANALTAAAAAKVPVLSGAAVDAGGPLASGLAAQSSQPFALTGELAADWIIADSGASAKVLFLTVPDVIGSTQEEKAFSDRMKQKCPQCTVTVEGTTLANWATDLATTTNAALLRDPNIGYVVPAFDPMTQFVGPAIQQAGKSASVKTVTVNGSLEQMKQVKSGAIAAEVGIDLNALGYIEADQMLRVLSGVAPVPVAYAPVRVFDAKNVGSLKLDEASRAAGLWFAAEGSYADQFSKSVWTK